MRSGQLQSQVLLPLLFSLLFHGPQFKDSFFSFFLFEFSVAWFCYLSFKIWAVSQFVRNQPFVKYIWRLWSFALLCFAWLRRKSRKGRKFETYIAKVVIVQFSWNRTTFTLTCLVIFELKMNKVTYLFRFAIIGFFKLFFPSNQVFLCLKLPFSFLICTFNI